MCLLNLVLVTGLLVWCVHGESLLLLEAGGRGLGEMILGIHRKHGRGKGKLPLVFYSNAGAIMTVAS